MGEAETTEGRPADQADEGRANGGWMRDDTFELPRPVVTDGLTCTYFSTAEPSWNVENRNYRFMTGYIVLKLFWNGSAAKLQLEE